jgi:hypothetical protein
MQHNQRQQLQVKSKTHIPPPSLIGKGLGYFPNNGQNIRGVHSAKSIITVLILNPLLRLKIVLFNLKFPY